MTDNLRRGLGASLPLAPTFAAIFIGVGIAATEAGVDIATIFFLTITVWAAPAQFAAFDMAYQGASVLAIIITASLANLRFIVMSLSLADMFRGVARWRLLLWAPFVAATPFILTWFDHRQRAAKGEERLGSATFDYYRGVGLGMVPPTIVGVTIGATMGGILPGPVAFGATLFYPVYFSLLIRQELKGTGEGMAVLGGVVMAPLIERVVPGWGVVIAGSLVGAAVTLGEKR